MTWLWRFVFLAVASLASGPCRAGPSCAGGVSGACYLAFEPPEAGGQLRYFASLDPAASAAPTHALIALHGHARDANRVFDAALLAVRRGARAGDTLVVAPLFQVDATRAEGCRTFGMPTAEVHDLQWTCTSWIEGGVSTNGARWGSFAALDALVVELVRQWPSLHTVTIAGFSAGAQMVQHAIGFAAAAPPGVGLRYVVADPGSWLYFDSVRPKAAQTGDCPNVNRWKYGTETLPTHLTRDALAARAHYAAADIHYLEGALDSDAATGAAHRLLDTSCAANAQGPFRLQRGLAYAGYDRALLAPAKQRRVIVVPGCAHDVRCVFGSPAAREALLGAPR